MPPKSQPRLDEVGKVGKTYHTKLTYPFIIFNHFQIRAAIYFLAMCIEKAYIFFMSIKHLEHEKQRGNGSRLVGNYF